MPKYIRKEVKNGRTIYIYPNDQKDGSGNNPTRRSSQNERKSKGLTLLPQYAKKSKRAGKVPGANTYEEKVSNRRKPGTNDLRTGKVPGASTYDRKQSRLESLKSKLSSVTWKAKQKLKTLTGSAKKRAEQLVEKAKNIAQRIYNMTPARKKQIAADTAAARKRQQEALEKERRRRVDEAAVARVNERQRQREIKKAANYYYMKAKNEQAKERAEWKARPRVKAPQRKKYKNTSN